MKKDSLVIPAVVLCLISIVVTGLLALTYNLTREAIEAQSEAQQSDNRTQLFPEAEYFVMLDLAEFDIDSENIREAFAVADEERTLLGSLFVGFSAGYSGEVPVMVAIGTDGVIIGARVLANSETPNLGTRIEEPEFLDQFNGLVLENQFALRNPEADQHQIDAVTAATASSRAVVQAVNAIAEAYSQIDIVEIFTGLDLEVE